MLLSQEPGQACERGINVWAGRSDFNPMSYMLDKYLKLHFKPLMFEKKCLNVSQGKGQTTNYRPHSLLLFYFHLRILFIMMYLLRE